MSEIQEIPISETEITDTSLSLIKNVPSAKDIQANLVTLRNEHGYTGDGIWSDARLETAAQGMEIYAKVINRSSDQLKQYLNNINVIQGFTGVRPVVGLGGQDPKTSNVESYFYSEKGHDTLFPQVREELQRLLEAYGKSKIKLVLIDYSKVPYKTKKDFDLMNVGAIQNVANENPDLFPADKSINPSDWLIQNPIEWPMTPLSEGKDAMTKEVRSGVVSGFPRSASNLYSEEATSGLDYFRTFKQMIFRSKGEIPTGVHKIEHKQLEGREVKQAVKEAGLPFLLYSESDLVWAKDAAALAKHSTEFIGLNISKK